MLSKPSKLAHRMRKFAATVARKRTAAQVKRAEASAWSATVKAVVARDGACRVCGRVPVPFGSYADPATWGHVHHIRYRSAGGSDELSNLVLLCGQCHDDEHQHRIQLSGEADTLWVSSLQGDGQP